MSEKATEKTYPPRVAARLTGLSVDLLRAWERRHAAVVPVRTAGGTRRYRSSDLDRLRLLKAGVDAGGRIGDLAPLSDGCLAERLQPASSAAEALADSEEILAALERLDAPEVQRRLAIHLAALGPSRFARSIALPLIVEVGERWAAGELSIASEHLATSTLRTQLGSALQASVISKLGPRIVFATPTDEPHEIGLLMAAVVAMGAGANPIYLGTSVPTDELLLAAETSRARVVAIGLVSLSAARASDAVGRLRDRLSTPVELWVGGGGSVGLPLPRGVSRSRGLEQLESQVSLLVEQNR